PAIIDEIQYTPSLLREIKVRVDAAARSGGAAYGLYILTGSQAFPLMEAVSESLAGRAAVLPLLGLSGEEWVAGMPANAGWEDFFFSGSFPGL
ncbi:MAG: AAA family ATPase, partial [Rectinemataceae bacterium]